MRASAYPPPIQIIDARQYNHTFGKDGYDGRPSNLDCSNPGCQVSWAAFQIRQEMCEGKQKNYLNRRYDPAAGEEE